MLLQVTGMGQLGVSDVTGVVGKLTSSVSQQFRKVHANGRRDVDPSARVLQSGAGDVCRSFASITRIVVQC